MFAEGRRYRHSRVRFFEREHGTEFLRFEMDQMRRFAAAKKARGEIELDGYAAWALPPYFVLVPAPTVHSIHVVCRAGRGVPYPDMNGFSTVRGRMGPAVLPDGRVDHVLQADDVRGADPGFGRIEPEMSYGDFVGLLFEKWRNVADTTQQLIAHTLLSSPDLPGRRTGGFTVTIDALTKRAILDDLAGDLRRFVPAEVRSGRPRSLRLPGLGAAGSTASASLPGLGWASSAAPLEQIPGAVDARLDRMPRGGADEYSITLLKKADGHLPLDRRGVRMSDYPAVLEEHVERRSYSYDTSPEVFKFLLAARMHRPAVGAAALGAAKERYRGMIARFIKGHEYLSAAAGGGQFLDMGHGGRPLSIYSVAASMARSRAADGVSEADLDRAGGMYVDNLKAVFDTIHDGAYDKFSSRAPLRYDERRMFACLGDRPESSAGDAAAALGIDPGDAAALMDSLYKRGLLYEPAVGRCSTVPSYAEA